MAQRTDIGAPLCAKDRRKDAQGAKDGSDAVSAGAGGSASAAELANGGRSSGCIAPVSIEKAHIFRLASQYTPCAGCSAAVKGLLEKPMSQLRLLNAVVEESGDCSSCARLANPANTEPTGPPAALGSGGACQCRALRLRGSYLANRGRLEQLLESFPLSSMMKKLQPRGNSLRCETHRRNAGIGSGSGAENWEWEDAWERLPAELREKVAAIDVSALEAAMHHATATHRFCADCKHNVVTAFDVLTNRYSAADLENDDEFNAELFWPFVNRVSGGDGDGPRVLSCPLDEIEELICWYEDFDSREFTRSSQRHAATLEHGQREIRSIVGSVLLTQLKAAWHNHLAQVQGEQYLFCLVLHAVRTHLAAVEGHEIGGSGLSAPASGGMAPPQPCPRCGDDVKPSCPHCGGTGLSAAELDLLLEDGMRNGDDDDKKGKGVLSKSRKKKDRKARAKARKMSTEECDHSEGGHMNNHSSHGHESTHHVEESHMNGGSGPLHAASHSSNDGHSLANGAVSRGNGRVSNSAGSAGKQSQQQQQQRGGRSVSSGSSGGGSARTRASEGSGSVNAPHRNRTSRSPSLTSPTTAAVPVAAGRKSQAAPPEQQRQPHQQQKQQQQLNGGSTGRAHRAIGANANASAVQAGGAGTTAAGMGQAAPAACSTNTPKSQQQQQPAFPAAPGDRPVGLSRNTSLPLDNGSSGSSSASRRSKSGGSAAAAGVAPAHAQPVHAGNGNSVGSLRAGGAGKASHSASNGVAGGRQPQQVAPPPLPPPPQVVPVVSQVVRDPLLNGGGSLLSMLDMLGEDEGFGDETDDSIDEDLLREMEKLKLQKSSDTQRSQREALRSNLQRNFEQLLSQGSN